MEPTRTHSFLALLAAGIAFPGAASAQILYVDGDLTTGAGDGSSWANAFKGSDGLHVALSSVVAGEEIWVTGGTYRPSLTGDVNERFQLDTDDVQLRGGFDGTELTRFQRPAPGLNPTILSGDLLGNDDGTLGSSVDNSTAVLRADGDRVLVENLDVIGGRAVPTPGTIQYLSAFLSVNSAEITLEHCRFRDNFGGGAIILSETAGAVSRAIDCAFERNGGYGLYADHYLSFQAFLELTRCVARDNGGSGFILAPDDFGADSITNCLAARNGVHGLHYLMFPEASLIRTVRNSTFVGNLGAGVRMDMCACFFGWVSVEESIVWGNGIELSGWAQSERSIVQGLADPILGADPLFRDVPGGDYSLLFGSPAIDRGTGAQLMPGELDLARRYRAFDLPGVTNAGAGPDDFVDYGAFEFTGSLGENGGCDAVPNSTGRSGRMFARGSLELAAGNFSVLADRVPAGQFGLFLASAELRPVPAPHPPRASASAARSADSLCRDRSRWLPQTASSLCP